MAATKKTGANSEFFFVHTFKGKRYVAFEQITGRLTLPAGAKTVALEEKGELFVVEAPLATDLATRAEERLPASELEIVEGAKVLCIAKLGKPVEVGLSQGFLGPFYLKAPREPESVWRSEKSRRMILSHGNRYLMAPFSDCPGAKDSRLLWARKRSATAPRVTVFENAKTKRADKIVVSVRRLKEWKKAVKHEGNEDVEDAWKTTGKGYAWSALDIAAATKEVDSESVWRAALLFEPRKGNDRCRVRQSVTFGLFHPKGRTGGPFVAVGKYDDVEPRLLIDLEGDGTPVLFAKASPVPRYCPDVGLVLFALRGGKLVPLKSNLWKFGHLDCHCD